MDDPRGGESYSTLQMNAFSILALLVRKCVCVRVFKRQGMGRGGGVLSPGGPEGESVTQSGCDYSQPPEKSKSRKLDEEVRKVLFSL